MHYSEAAEISEAKDGFMDHHYYNEEILYQIGGAASNILGKSSVVHVFVFLAPYWGILA